MTSLNLVLRDFRTQRRTANTGSAPVIAPFRPGPPQTHHDLVIRRIVLDLVMVGVVLSLISVGVFIVAGAAVAAATLFRARSSALRRHRHLSELNLTGIDEIDEALDRILAQEHSTSRLA
ncbi:MAG TPA: hypothetical protein VGS06_34430 [Streptosporangiaceae bacterium]|nr:hypothetical protein [Streptosporangiaceae bacterium]